MESNGTHHVPTLAAIGMVSATAMGAPVLPDWTQATFDGTSATITNAYFPRPVGLLSVYEGEEEDGFERVKSFSTFRTTNILGVETRVVRDTEFIDGVLVEVADDWFAQDTDGNVWYFGEFVVNYEYNAMGELIGTNNDGSWIADGVTNLPGVIMWASPMVGAEYYQEFAPGVALDFALVVGLTDTVDIGFGSFANVLNTGEGNLIDGSEIVEHKLYAPDIGLVLIQALGDDGGVEFEIELIRQRFVPAPGGAALGLAALGALARRRRTV